MRKTIPFYSIVSILVLLLAALACQLTGSAEPAPTALPQASDTPAATATNTPRPTFTPKPTITPDVAATARYEDFNTLLQKFEEKNACDFNDGNSNYHLFHCSSPYVFPPGIPWR